jgi:putative hemolysin
MGENFKRMGLLLIMFNGLLGCERENKVGLSNPASQNCVTKGGKIVMAQRCDGGEYGICIFPNNFQCEEWAMFRGECPLGGVDLATFQTVEGRYCALKGGKNLNSEAQCHLPSGKICTTQELYEGKCQ